MSNLLYFSGIGNGELWEQRFVDNAAHMLPWFTWDATPDLGQATWEWPKRPEPSAVARVAASVVAWSKVDWGRRGQKEFARHLYGS